MTDPRFATSLSHGLEVLETFADGASGLTNAGLADRTGLSPATISRITTTLAARGLTRVDPQTRQHRLASTALTLGYPLLADLDVRRLARLPMRELADELGASVSLGIRDRTRMVYVETARGSEPLAFRPDVGAALPMLQTAMGRAWLASAPVDERRELLASIRCEAPDHFARWQSSVDVATREWRQQGFCVSRGDWQFDVHAVAVPLAVMPDGQRLILNCGVPARGLAARDLERRIGPRLLTLAGHLAAESARSSIVASPSPMPSRWTARADLAHAADDRHFSHTLARGIDTLLCFHPGDGALGNRELARRVGVSPQTMVRLTYTLVHHGYLRRDAAPGRYRLGAAALAAAYPMLSGLRVRHVARPAMLALSQLTGGAVSLGLRHLTGMVYVETAWRTDGRLLPPDTGAPMPMLATAIGRAWLCGAAPAERRAMLNRLKLSEPEAHARFAGDIARALADFERLGHCSSRDFRPEIQAFAVPFAHPVDAVRYVMNCGVLAPVPLSAAQARQVATALTSTVRDVESALA